MGHPFTALTLDVVLLLAPASHAVSTASEDRTIIFGSAHGSVSAPEDYAAARYVIARHIDDIIPAPAAGTALPRQSVRGTVSVIDERNDRLALRLPNDGSEDFKVKFRTASCSTRFVSAMRSKPAWRTAEA